MLSSRRKAREATLKALYGIEVAQTRLLDSVAEMRSNNEDLSPDMLAFSEMLLKGVYDKRTFLDEGISSTIPDWNFDRVAAVDRNLLRIAAFEFFFCDDIPPAVTINEAIELAKKYSTAESGKFVNGVLAKVLQSSPKANWDPSKHINEPMEQVAPPEVEPEIPVEEIREGTPEAKELGRIGNWNIRSKGER